MGVLTKPREEAPVRIFWLSFADPKRPAGTQFLGCCLVEAGDLGTAVRVAHLRGCNPGGEVLGVLLPPTVTVHPSWLGVLLDRATIERNATPEDWAKPRESRR